MPINKRTLVKRAGIVFFTLLLLAVAGVSIGPLYERWRAEQLLTLLQQTKVGVTTEAEFRSAAARQFRFNWIKTSEDDRKSYKDIFSQSVSNSFGWEKLAPWSIFTAEVIFDKGIVVRKSASIAFGNSAEYAGNVSEWVQIPQMWIGDFTGTIPPPPHHTAGYEFNPWHRFYVMDDVGASEAEKYADWNINLACISMFSSCHDSRELFPDARITSTLQWKQDR